MLVALVSVAWLDGLERTLILCLKCKLAPYDLSSQLGVDRVVGVAPTNVVAIVFLRRGKGSSRYGATSIAPCGVNPEPRSLWQML